MLEGYYLPVINKPTEMWTKTPKKLHKVGDHNNLKCECRPLLYKLVENDDDLSKL